MILHHENGIKVRQLLAESQVSTAHTNHDRTKLYQTNINELSRGFAYVQAKIVYKNEKSRCNMYETICKV
jgi:hypothetical protein